MKNVDEQMTTFCNNQRKWGFLEVVPLSSAEWLHQTAAVEGDKALDCAREPLKVRPILFLLGANLDLEFPTPTSCWVKVPLRTKKHINTT